MANAADRPHTDPGEFVVAAKPRGRGARHPDVIVAIAVEQQRGSIQTAFDALGEGDADAAMRADLQIILTRMDAQIKRLREQANRPKYPCMRCLPYANAALDPQIPND